MVVIAMIFPGAQASAFMIRSSHYTQAIASPAAGCEKEITEISRDTQANRVN
jgi:hypothetical protein